MKVSQDRHTLIRELIRPGTIGAEIGVRRGEFSLEFLKLPIARIYLIDAWSDGVGEPVAGDEHDRNYQQCVKNLAGHAPGGRFKIIRGKSVEVANAWSGPLLDWVYLDAAHEYEAVRDDLVAWLPRLQPDAIILGHDWTDTAETAVRLKFGVIKAVTEFLVQHPDWKMTHITNDEYASYCLQR